MNNDEQNPKQEIYVCSAIPKKLMLHFMNKYKYVEMVELLNIVKRQRAYVKMCVCLKIYVIKVRFTLEVC